MKNRDLIVRASCRVRGAILRCYTSPIYVTHYCTRNWGDAVNKLLMKKLTGRAVRTIDPQAEPGLLPGQEKYLVIGSTAHFADDDTIVWGAGLLHENKEFHGSPKRICAVRGPRTREIMLRKGFDVPEVFGDPAVLLPKLLGVKCQDNPTRIGVIPHYIDADSPTIRQLLSNDERFCLINIKARPLMFLRDIASCKSVISTSLHGVIAAESLEIPACWACVSDRVLGHGFKFFDYYEGTNRTISGPYHLTGDETHDTVQDLAMSSPSPDIDTQSLIDAFPAQLSDLAKYRLGTA